MALIETPEEGDVHRDDVALDSLAVTILERSQDGFYAIDTGWRFVYVNRRACELWGATRETILGRVLWQCFPQLSGTCAGRLLREAVEAGVPTEFECVSPIIDRWLWVRVDPLPSGITGVYWRDITDRKRVEEALRESERRLALAQEGAGFGVWDWNLLTDEIHWSPQMFSVLGLDPERDAADPYGAWLRILHPQDREAAHAHAQRFREHPESFALDFRILRGDGTVCWILSQGTVLADRDGRAVRAVGIDADITERKRAEEAVRESEQRFRTMLEALPHIAFVLRPDGEMEFWNRRYVEYIGTAVTDLAGRAAFHHPEDRARAFAARAQGVASGSEYAFAARLRRHDGIHRWHTINVRPLHRGDAIVAWFGTAVDIDDMRRANELLERRVVERTAALDRTNRALMQQIEDRERAEAALLQAQKMEAVGQLTGGVAHDFNNLLTAVIGCLEMIPREHSQQRIVALSQIALRAATRGARLTQQLLAFARRQTLQPVTADLNAMLAEMEMLLRRAVGEAIEIVFARCPALWPCEVDPAQFQAAVMNLVMNARDAMPNGGRLSIETRNIAPAQLPVGLDLQPGEYVVLAVRDVGAGMTPEVLARAFEPFFTTKDVGKGSGLGLSMVYGFAKQSGGGVHIDSAPALGTCVTIYLPRSRSPARPDEPDHADESPERGSGNVLLVEDDDEVREVSAMLLQRLGYRVTAVADGRQALSLLHGRDRFDVLFTDIAMPLGMSGVELASRARALRPGLRILLTTGHAGADRRDHGGFPVLAKPFRPAELGRALAELTGRNGAA
jgi:PAS domain S-box-containing protein